MMLIAVAGQKGGVGKSTLARLLAVELLRNNYQVLLADLDPQQQSSRRWAQRREHAGVAPLVESRVYRTTRELSAALGDYQVVVADGAPHATEATAWLARHAVLTVLPTGQSVDDLEPTLRLGLELAGDDVPLSRLVVTVTRTTGSHRELLSTGASLRDAGLPYTRAHLPLSTAYAQAQDVGRTLTETKFSTLNARADRLAQQLFDHLQEATNG